jgi:glycosyltransferase involved in cell wall biosynthesis
MPYVAKDRGHKIVSLPHNFDSLAGADFNPLNRKKNLDLLSNEIKHLAQADRVFCISREEQWFLRLCGVDSDYLPYYPPTSVVCNLLQIREARTKSYNDYNSDSKKTKQFLILGTYSNPPTRLGILELVKKLKNIEKNCSFEIQIAGFGTENLKNEIDNSSRFKILGTLSNKELIDVMIKTSAVLLYQSYGLGSLTKIPEMLIAGIPIIANSIASRSYFDYNGIFIYENNQELAELIFNENFCLPKLPPPPTQHEYRFLDYITQSINAN